MTPLDFYYWLEPHLLPRLSDHLLTPPSMLDPQVGAEAGMVVPHLILLFIMRSPLLILMISLCYVMLCHIVLCFVSHLFGYIVLTLLTLCPYVSCELKVTFSYILAGIMYLWLM